MTDANKRAMKKTALTVAVIIALIIIVSIFPFLAGYLVLGFFISVIVGIIYLMFAMWEDQKEWNKRKR